jgi:hypothetical protein
VVKTFCRESSQRAQGFRSAIYVLLTIRILFSQHNFSAGWKDNELKHLAERDDYYGSGVGKVLLTLRVRFGCGVAAVRSFVAVPLPLSICVIGEICG